MAKIKTFELDRWSEPDEKRRVRHIGMADAKETFDRLQTHLELKGLLPDEYFLFSDELTGELPEFDQALCIPNFGASEGIYLDISLACRDKDGKRCFQNFATGKTLGETADDYEIPVFHKALSECGSLEVRPLAICVPQEIQEYCMEFFGEDVQIAAASHDLFAKRANGQIYRPLMEKYIAGEKRL